MESRALPPGFHWVLLGWLSSRCFVDTSAVQTNWLLLRFTDGTLVLFWRAISCCFVCSLFFLCFFALIFPKKSSHSSMYNLFVFFQFWHDLHVFPLGLPTFLHFSLDFLVFLSRSFQGERAQMMNRCMNQKRTNETPMMFFPVCFWLFVNLFVRVILNLPCLFWIL